MKNVKKLIDDPKSSLSNIVKPTDLKIPLGISHLITMSDTAGFSHCLDLYMLSKIFLI